MIVMPIRKLGSYNLTSGRKITRSRGKCPYINNLIWHLEEAELTIQPDVFSGLFCQKNPDGDHCPRMIPGPSPIGRGLIRLRDTPDHCHWMGLQITPSRVIIGLGAGDYLYHIRAGLFTHQVTHMLLRHHNISSGHEAVAMVTDALFSLCLPISVLYLLLGGDQGINCDLPVNHLTIIATWLLTNLDLEISLTTAVINIYDTCDENVEIWYISLCRAISGENRQ